MFDYVVETYAALSADRSRLRALTEEIKAHGPRDTLGVLQIIDEQKKLILSIDSHLKTLRGE